MAYLLDLTGYGWIDLRYIKSTSYRCGYCNMLVSSDRGYPLAKFPDGTGEQVGGNYICPNCNRTTFITPYNCQIPPPVMGNQVDHLPQDLELLYEEARRCTGQECYTGAVLLCRKIMMHIAVDCGAKAGLSFMKYVDYLADNSYVPPGSKAWVDHIRRKGNEANHEIVIMQKDDAENLVSFVEMLLRIVHEFPNRVPGRDQSQKQ